MGTGDIFLGGRCEQVTVSVFLLSLPLVVVPQALNVTLNVLQKHYVDRDLTRSGNSVVMISAGTGVFYVDGGLSGASSRMPVPCLVLCQCGAVPKLCCKSLLSWSAMQRALYNKSRTIDSAHRITF